MAVLLLVFIGLFNLATSQLVSPCPDVLNYETRTRKNDRWYGVLSLRSSEDLTGVWITVLFDRRVELLGNWFGEATSTDNKEFSIINQKYQMEAGSPVSVRFFVKYQPGGTVPNVVSVRLNGKTICEIEAEPTGPVLHISHTKPTTSPSHVYNIPSNTDSDTGSSSWSRPTNSDSGTGSSTWNKPTNSNSGTGSSTWNNPTNSNSGTGTSSWSRPTNSDRGTGSSSRPTNSDNGMGSSSWGNPTNSDDGSGISTWDKPHSSGKNPVRPVITERPYSTNRQPIGLDRPNSSGKNPVRPVNTERPYSNNRQPIELSDDHDSDTTNHETAVDKSRTGYGDSGSTDTNYVNNGHNSGYSPNGNAGTSEGADDDYFPGDFAHLTTSKETTHTPKVPPKKKTCGIVSATSSARPLIANGQDTSPGQWPWHAALYHSKGIQLTYSCGGTLISQRHVLTAAHCVTKPRTNKLVNKKGLLVYLGKYNLVTFGSEVQESVVEKIYVHPEYNATSFFNDIAILKLVKEINFTDYVRPCCLWDGTSDLESIVDQAGTVVGWGFDENRNVSNKLMQAQMPVVSTVSCIYSNREFFSQFTFDKNYCAGFRNGTTVCNGDSGGGMVFPKRSGQTVAWFLRGVVSVGVALQGQGVCDPSQYILFTDVAKYTRWIKQILADQL